MILSRLTLILLMLATCHPAICAEANQDGPFEIKAFQSSVRFEPFASGERVAFLGDSITASGDYMHMLRLFYATRFPDRPVRFYNCGIGGATAASSWSRIDQDCLDLDPSQVVVMLGMNDSGNGFTASRFNQYKDAMSRIMDRVVEQPSRKLALIVSSPYDQTAQFSTTNRAGKNDAIRRFGDWLAQQASERKVPLVDLNTPMLRINQKQQVNDPAFSVIGKDRIHPGEQGHTVMLYHFLRAQGIKGPVAKAEIDAATGLAKAENASVDKLTLADGRLSFTYKPKALPYPVKALPFKSPDREWVPFTEELNREWLIVKGLKEGRWLLTINDAPVAAYTAADLAKGIDLAREPKYPGLIQANKVYVIAKQVEEAQQNLRAIARVRWLVLERQGIGLDDTERADAALRKLLDAKPSHTYWQERGETFFRFRAPEQREAECQRMEELMGKLYEVNKPKAARFTLRYVTD